ncbi:MAG TPA: NAD(P)(+) transhydrogenase (Re/Si-specific) subunit beta [Thermoanaerobaculia bacterium]|nr:NAD(P)(+) transhydrogenase (Re/Si-specific) subunit beta [Thermoanaerobaculia bacterium]
MNGTVAPGFVTGTVVPLLYLLSAVLFIFGIKGLTRVRTARRGNLMAAGAMLLAIAATLIDLGSIDYRWILGGLVVGGAIGGFAAVKVAMTEMPEMVALFNGAGGGASTLVALSILWLEMIEEPGVDAATMGQVLGPDSALSTVLSILIGSITLSGSLIAYLKLRGKISGQPILLPGRHVINLALLLAALGIGLWAAFVTLEPGMMGIGGVAVTVAALVLGVMLVIPIGGADMPVVISLLNSYSGLAAAATGFVINNNLLIISGALVGASGLILTQIMCVAMNRTLANVLFGGFGMQDTATGGAGADSEYGTVRSYSAEEVAMILENAESVVFVPGYGLAVAQAQHTVRELADLLQQRGSTVSYGIHPVAGRMPGHMNVLLAEADVPYEQLLEMDQVNPQFKETDVVLIVGANDVVNPAAENVPGSPIAGMPVLKVWDAGTTVVIKRSLSPGFAGIKNPLFENENNIMVFGDAKKVLQELVAELKQVAAA